MTQRDLGLTYDQALHAVQSGVAFEHSKGSHDGTPKHLRVGVNSAQCGVSAIARLLIEKGIITLEEHDEAQRREMNEEVARYEDRAGGRVQFR